MKSEDYLYSRLIAIHNFNLRKKELRASFAAYVFGLVIDIRSGNHGQSVLYVLHDTQDHSDLRRILAKKTIADEASVADKWQQDDGGVLWLSPNRDQLMPDHTGIALRDAYLAEAKAYDPPSAYLALVDQCAAVIRRFHAHQSETQSQDAQIPVVLEILGGDDELQKYAQDQGFQATPLHLQSQYQTIVQIAKHRTFLENGTDSALSRIVLANKIAQELTDFVTECRLSTPIQTQSELSPVERDQYTLIRTKLAEWLPKAHLWRSYTLEVFGTGRPGLAAFHDLIDPSSNSVFCLTSDEYRQYRNMDNNETRDFRQTIHYQWHTFEHANFNNMTESNRSVIAQNPIPSGNQYWIERQGSYTGLLYAGGHSNLWQSDGTEMTLITGLDSWVS